MTDYNVELHTESLDVNRDGPCSRSGFELDRFFARLCILSVDGLISVINLLLQRGGFVPCWTIV